MMPATPRVYLSSAAVGCGSQVGDVALLEHVDRRFGQRFGQPDVDEPDLARAVAPGAAHQARFERAERHGGVGPDGVLADPAGVGVDSGGQVDGDRQPIGGDRSERRRRATQLALATDAEDPVDDDVGPRDSRIPRPPRPGRGRRRGAVRPAARRGRDPAAARSR